MGLILNFYVITIGLTIYCQIVSSVDDIPYIYMPAGTQSFDVRHCFSGSDSPLSLSCDPGQVIIVLHAEMWSNGVTSQSYCPEKDANTTTTLTTTVDRRCNGQRTCSLHHSDFSEKSSNVLRVKYQCLPLDNESIMDICGYKSSTRLGQMGGYLVNPEFPALAPDRARYCECMFQPSASSSSNTSMGIRVILAELRGDEKLTDCHERLTLYSSELLTHQCSNKYETNFLLYDITPERMQNNVSVILTRQPFPYANTGRVLISFTSTEKVDISCFNTDVKSDHNCNVAINPPTSTSSTSHSVTLSVTPSSSTGHSRTESNNAMQTQSVSGIGILVGVLGGVSALLLVFLVTVTVCFVRLKRAGKSDSNRETRNGVMQPMSRPHLPPQAQGQDLRRKSTSLHKYDYIYFSGQERDTHIPTSGAVNAMPSAPGTQGAAGNTDDGYLNPVSHTGQYLELI